MANILKLREFPKIQPFAGSLCLLATGLMTSSLSLQAEEDKAISPAAKTTTKSVQKQSESKDKNQDKDKGQSVAASTVHLGTVTVTAEVPTETAWGPMQGYVATQSATGSKTDTPVLETPQTINVVGREEIRARASQNISNALSYTPGIQTEMFGPSTRDDYFNIRGFDGTQYLDGTRLEGTNYANLRIEPYALERVEVLKGPASVLYGQNPAGGLVNMVSKRPTLEPLREIQMLGGSFDRVQGTMDFSGPIDKAGKFLYRLTALGRNSDTQVDYSGDDRYFVAPSLTWQPNENTSLTLLSHYQKDKAGNTMQFLPPEGTQLPNPNGKIPTNRFLGEPTYDHYDREQYSVGYAFQHRFDDVWQVRQNMRFSDVNTNYPVIIPLGFVTDEEGNITDYRTLSRYAALYQEQADTLTLDNQAQADFKTGPVSHKILTGVDYRNFSGDRQRGFSSPPNDPADIDVFNPVYGKPFVRPTIDYSVQQDRDQVGIYAQDQIKYGGLMATLGVRHDWASANTQETDLLLGGGLRTRQNDDAFTYRTGLSYLFDIGLAPYFSYTESFDPVAGTDFAGTPFVPTTGQQYEVGVKYQPIGYNAFVTLSLFHLTQQNMVTADPDPAHIGYNIQTGEARSQGVELEGKASLAEGLNLTASYSYIDSDITKTTEADQLGKNLPYTPKHRGSAWLDYTVPKGVMAGFGIGSGVRVVGSNYGDLSNSLGVPSYTLIDASMHYDLGGVHSSLKGARLAVNFTNLFDREYLVTCGEGACYYGNRRNILASLRYNW